MAMRILLTGATGFVGHALSSQLLIQESFLTVVVRNCSNIFPKSVDQIVLGDLSANIDWENTIRNIDCIIHVAGKAHVIDTKKSSVLDEFRKINTIATLNLANRAAKSGVKRFIFISSIGVNGNQNSKPFTEQDQPNPQEPYAVSKYEAEQGLFKISKKTGLEVVIIRPPLVYGLNAPGNFGRLLHWANVKHPIPLPFGSINNSRSLVALDNLVDFIVLCISHKKAANEVFLLSDGDDLSTTQLLQNILKIYNKKTLLLPVPVSLMLFFAKLIGKKSDAVRLFSSLRVDSSKARDLLEWKPIVTMKDQLKL
jgi:nucleoside-diphosphate-sugar epimerase